MFARVWTIALNTYREAVRARILHGLLGLSLLTLGYALIVSAYTLNNQSRAVVNLGTASISVYGIVVSILIGATSLFRELELKTIFPILARPIHRGEYIIGKFLGTLLVLAVFFAMSTGLLLLAVAAVSASLDISRVAIRLGIFGAGVGLAAFLSRRNEAVRRGLTWLPIPGSLLLLAVGYLAASEAVQARTVVVGSVFLSFLEIGIVTAVTLLMASFSSPFLTAIFSLGIVIVGRSADSLARLPAKMFGEVIHSVAAFMSRIVPNLMVYVPPRRLLAGEMTTVALGTYMLEATVQALAWATLLIVLSIVVFRRRDFL